MKARGQKLAIDGGTPVRSKLLPYGRQSIGEEDIAAVVDALRSDWLTTGPRVGQLEDALRAPTGAREVVAVSNGTAALHAAMFAIGVGPGDEVIVPAMTFAATANAVVYQGATPVFVDVRPDTLLVDVEKAVAAITPRTKAIVAVDYAGQPCDYDALRQIAATNGIALVSDGCHALGAAWRGRPVGSLADLTCFSFHPVKHVTTGEGGAIATDDARLAEKMRSFRNHGIVTDHRERERQGTHAYDMVALGYNYRLTDVQCALGISQISKLCAWVERRRAIAALYDRAFSGNQLVQPLTSAHDARHSYHLYVVRLAAERLRGGRDAAFRALRAEGIGVNVHYRPVHLHPFYRARFGTREGLCPEAEKAGGEILSLPMFPEMTDHDVQDVVDAMDKVGRTLA